MTSGARWSTESGSIVKNSTSIESIAPHIRAAYLTDFSGRLTKKNIPHKNFTSCTWPLASKLFKTTLDNSNRKIIMKQFSLDGVGCDPLQVEHRLTVDSAQHVPTESGSMGVPVNLPRTWETVGPFGKVTQTFSLHWFITVRVQGLSTDLIDFPVKKVKLRKMFCQS